MGDYYGYSPAQYANDFSWIGDIGKQIGQFATQIPELLEANRTIKENNNFKQMSYAASNKFIDNLDDGIVSNVASSMHLDAKDVSTARQKLKEMIPKFSDKTTNEEYAKQVVDSFYSPFMGAAHSEMGGGKLTVGDIIANTNYGVLQDAIRNTSQGKEYQNEQEYQKEFARKYGQQGEVQTGLDIQNKNSQQQNEQQYQTEQTRKQELGQKYAPVVEKYIKSGLSSDQVYAGVYKETNDPEVAKEAAAQVKAQEDNDLKTELRRMQDEARKALANQDKLAKVYDLDKIDRDIGTVESSIAKYEGIMANSKTMNSAEKANYKGTINLLKKQLAVYEKVKVNLIEHGGSFTQDEVNTARLRATQSVDPEAEQELIRKYNANVSQKEGGFSGGMIGRGDDQKRFKQAYYERFGKEAKFDNNGNPVPQMGESVNMNTGSTPTQDSVNTDLGKQKAIALIAALETAITKETDTNKISIARKKINDLKQQFGL
jgi:hypothetical protein